MRQKVFKNLPDYLQFALTHLLEQIQLLEQHIENSDHKLRELLPESQTEMKLLMSIPGIGVVFARTILAEMFDIHNFKAPKYLISYSGLAPIENSSSDKKGRIVLNRQCNYYLKYAFIGAAHGAHTHVRYRRKYNEDVKKHGKNRAKLNLARHLTKTIYRMLIHQQPFRF